jgi:hypothetical protein
MLLVGLQMNSQKKSIRPSNERAISAGAIEIAKPTKKPWGQVVSYVQDLKDFSVGFFRFSEGSIVIRLRRNLFSQSF